MKIKYRLAYDKLSPHICPQAFCNAYGITNYLRKQLTKEVKEGLFHLSSSKQQDYHNNAIDSDTMKNIKRLLKQSNLKLPTGMEVNMELPNSIGVLKVRKNKIK